MGVVGEGGFFVGERVLSVFDVPASMEGWFGEFSLILDSWLAEYYVCMRSVFPI